MRNLFLKQCAILFGMFILVSSCSSDDISDEQLKVTENFNYQKFYEDYKDEIHDLSRDEFAGMNLNLRYLAYQNLSPEKKTKWWVEKLEEVLKLNSTNDKQKLFLRDVISKFKPNIFDEKNNESSSKLIEYIEKEGRILWGNDLVIHNIFGDLGNVNDEFQLENEINSEKVMTKRTFKAVGLDVKFNFNEYEKGGIDPGPEPLCDEPTCNTRSCVLCSPVYSDCNSACCRTSSGCGLVLMQSCVRRCRM